MKLSIAWLYPTLMGTYGDRGNIISLVKRCAWRGIEVEVRSINRETDPEILASSNLIFMGGAQDRQQKIVAEDIFKNKGAWITKMVKNGVPALFVCASYQFMGRFYRAADGTEIPGLGLFDLYTVNPGLGVKRCIGDLVVEVLPGSLALPPLIVSENKVGPNRSTLVGFENHGGRTFLGPDVKPLGRVLRGYGNNGRDRLEGAVYRNAIGCYCHGPLLPRNPHLSDFLISQALDLNYADLRVLPDTLEKMAHLAALPHD